MQGPLVLIDQGIELFQVPLMSKLNNDELVAQWNQDPLLAFKEGVKIGFARWDSLEAAIENGWGGRDASDKKKMLFDDIIELFTKSSQFIIELCRSSNL